MRKVVFFLSPDLESYFTPAVSCLTDWETTVISTDPTISSVDLLNVESLKDALNGVRCCFVATHTDFSKDRQCEVQIGQCIGKACKATGVAHVIVSGQVHCEKTIGIPARHYDAKAEIYQYYRFDLQLPVTMVSIPPFFEMFLSFLCPVFVDQDAFDVVFPSVGPAQIDFMSAEDVGFCILPIIDNSQIFMHKSVCLTGDHLRGDSVTKLLSRLSGCSFTQKQVTVQDVRDRPYQGAIDLANMFEFLGRGDLKSSLSGTKELYPGIQSFEQWLQTNIGRVVETAKNHMYQRYDNPTTVI